MGPLKRREMDDGADNDDGAGPLWPTDCSLLQLIDNEDFSLTRRIPFCWAGNWPRFPLPKKLFFVVSCV